jgi:hypothetical protein
MASFRNGAEAFPGMSGMIEGNDRYDRSLKPWALGQGVVHFSNPTLEKTDMIHTLDRIVFAS